MSGPRATLPPMAGIAASPAFLAAGWSVDVPSIRAAFAPGCAACLQEPARLTIAFGHPADAGAFERAYRRRHVPLVIGLPHRASVVMVFASPAASGPTPRFHRITTVEFDRLGDLAAALASPAGQALLSGVAAISSGNAWAEILPSRRTIPT